MDAFASSTFYGRSLRCPVASGRSNAVAPEGRRFRAGWAVNQDQVYRWLASGSGMGGCPQVNHYGALMRMSRPRCVEPPHSNRPGESEDLPGREPSEWLGSAFGVTDSLRCSQTRLALCGNGVKALALRTCHGQRVAGVTDVQEPSNKRTADNGPVRSSGAALLIERVKDGNASGTEKIDPT